MQMQIKLEQTRSRASVDEVDADKARVDQVDVDQAMVDIYKIDQAITYGLPLVNHTCVCVGYDQFCNNSFQGMF